MQVPIRVTVLGLFLFLSTLILSSMFYIQSNLSEELAKKSMSNYFEMVTFKIEQNIKVMNEKNSALINSGSSFLKTNHNTLYETDEEKYLKIFTSILNDTTKLYAVYLGFSDDSFYEIIKLDIDKNLRNKFGAKDTDEWLQIEIKNSSTKIISLFDARLKKTSIKKVKNTYKPTLRPWYKNSQQTNSTTKTGPYQFSNIDARGITYAKKIDTNTIFAVDVLLNDFSTILNYKNKTNSLESYIFSKNGDIIATSSKNDKIYQSILQKIKSKELNTVKQNTIKINNKTYLYNISNINSIYTKNEYLLSHVLLNEMVSPYKEKFNQMDKIIIALLLVLIPIIWYFASIIVKPILALIEESKKVRNREFSKIKRVHSDILEVEILSSSLKTMAKSIHSYQNELEQKVEKRTKELYEKNKELEILSITDKLTNTYNRIKLDETIDIEIQRVARKNTRFGIIIIDIDKFKEVNDTHGHQVGDSVLVEFANILKTNTRKTDVVGRWGGEEFIIISLDADLKEMLSLAEILRGKIKNHTFTTIGTKTASFGVSTYKHNETAEQLINRADEALYLAKNNGRDRVETLEKNNT